MSRFLVLGAGGMAGHMVALYLAEQGHNVVGFARRDTGLFDCIVGDARQRDDVRDAVAYDYFDVVVNAIGILNDDADARPADAIYLNSFLPHYLAELTADSDMRVFHLSTDCVFAGNTGPYTEDSVPDGQTLYDRTKALGELIDEKNVTLRNSIVGPDLKPDGKGLLNWFMHQDGVIQGYTKAIWTGLTTLELAKTVEHLAGEEVSGLINMVPEDSISKYDLLRLFNSILVNNRVSIEPSATLDLDKTLTRTNFTSSFRPRDYASQVRDLARWMDEHKELYPHYER